MNKYQWNFFKKLKKNKTKKLIRHFRKQKRLEVNN